MLPKSESLGRSSPATLSLAANEATREFVAKEVSTSAALLDRLLKCNRPGKPRPATIWKSMLF